MKNNKRTLGLYVHIPFCVQKCNYCDFLSAPGSVQAKERYVKALLCEMEGWQDRLSDYEVDTVFIGGGTPSVLSVRDMDAIFHGMAASFPMRVSECTVECNPGTVTQEKLALYREAGVSRISIGLQSASEEELRTMGRIHTYGEFVETYKAVRAHGFDNVNVDVMSAIPGQTVRSYEDTLQKVIRWEPEHISSYSLILEEGTPFYERYAGVPPVDEETDRQMYEKTGELLGKAGYGRYEISNYARTGKECRHNLKYWHREEYLGLGLGAASHMGHCRYANVRVLEKYEARLAHGENPVGEEEVLAADEEKAEFMYLGLRCMRGVSARKYRACFGEEMESRFGEAIRYGIDQGLLFREGDRICLSKRGIDISNRVFELFL